MKSKEWHCSHCSSCGRSLLCGKQCATVRFEMDNATLFQQRSRAGIFQFSIWKSRAKMRCQRAISLTCLLRQPYPPKPLPKTVVVHNFTQATSQPLLFSPIPFAYSVLFLTDGSAHQQTIILAKKLTQIGCSTQVPLAWAIRPVKNGATAPPLLPADAMKPTAGTWILRGSRREKIVCTQG